MDELTNILINAYDPEELVTIFEVDSQEFITMLMEVYPEKYDDNIYKIKGEEDEDA